MCMNLLNDYWKFKIGLSIDRLIIYSSFFFSFFLSFSLYIFIEVTRDHEPSRVELNP